MPCSPLRVPLLACPAVPCVTDHPQPSGATDKSACQCRSTRHGEKLQESPLFTVFPHLRTPTPLTRRNEIHIRTPAVSTDLTRIKKRLRSPLASNEARVAGRGSRTFFDNWIPSIVVCEVKYLTEIEHLKVLARCRPLAGDGSLRANRLAAGWIGLRSLRRISGGSVRGRCDQATKSVWWMSWRQEAMKDVGTCDKPREAGNQAVILGFLNGETRPVRGSSAAECIGRRGELRELKHLST